MKLFTKEIDKKLFAQYKLGSDLANQEVVAKIFNPYGRGVWYILNSDPNDPDYLWAIVDLLDVEVGSVSRAELESIKVPPFGLKLERDLYFTPRNAKEVYEGALNGKRFDKGGTTDENAQMVLNQNKQIAHHTEELPNAVKKASHVPAWVVAKVNRSANDLSDATHYLDGESSMMRGGGNVKLISEGQEYRYMGINYIEKDIIDKIRPQIAGLKFAGNFSIKGSRTDGYLYFLDDFDKKLVENIPLKHNERIYRYYTRNTAIGGMMPLLKINLDSGLIYFNEAKDFGDETIKFGTKGEKAEYINLVKATDSDYYAQGGGVEDELQKAIEEVSNDAKKMSQVQKGTTYVVDYAKNKDTGIDNRISERITWATQEDIDYIKEKGWDKYFKVLAVYENGLSVKFAQGGGVEDTEAKVMLERSAGGEYFLFPKEAKGKDLGIMLKGGGNISSKATYVPNREIKEISVDIKGKSKTLKGSDILDGMYVKKKSFKQSKKTTPAPAPAPAETKNKYYVEFLNSKKNFQKDIKYFDTYQEAKEWMVETFDKFDPDMISSAYGQGGNIFDFDYSKLVGKRLMYGFDSREGTEKWFSTIAKADVTPANFRYRSLNITNDNDYTEIIKEEDIKSFLKGDWVELRDSQGEYYVIKLMDKVKFAGGGGVEDKEIQVSVYKNGKFSGTKKVMFMDAVESKTLDPMSREWNEYYTIRQEDKDKMFVPKETGEDAEGYLVYTEIWGLPAYTNDWFEKGGSVDDIDMNEVEKSAIFYTDETRWSTKPTIEKFQKDLFEYKNQLLKLERKEITPAKIVGGGYKSSAIARKVATKWLKEKILIQERAIEILKAKGQSFEKGGTTPKQQKKIGKVMHEFKEGDLKTSAGTKVTNPKQAVAIALSEAGVPKKGWGHKKGYRK